MIQIIDLTQSKFNSKYVEVVRDILALFVEAPYHECDITILTPYAAQPDLYVPIIGALHIMTEYPMEASWRVDRGLNAGS